MKWLKHKLTTAYSPADEEVVSASGGHPYDVLPKGYPHKIKTELIQTTVDKLLKNLLVNAGVESIANKNYTLINLGLHELNNRKTQKQSQTAFWLSVVSILVAAIALFT